MMARWQVVLLNAFLSYAVADRLSSPSQAPMSAAINFLNDRAQCPGNTFACPTSLGAEFKDICCQNGQTCALDAENSPACCPSGAVCTGRAPATATGSSPTEAVSYVANSYFSFPYAPTSFTNSASCASATKACSQNYDACITNLGSGGYAVTVNVPGGGGTTVNGADRSLGSSATSICASLSTAACAKLEATKCDTFGKDSHAGKTMKPLSILFLLGAGVISTCSNLV